MKQFWCHLLMALSCSSYASACPELSGVYLCKQNSYRSDTLYTYSQAQTGSTWTYKVSATPKGAEVASLFEFTADGVEQNVVDQVSGMVLRLTATCTADHLHVVGEGNLDKPVHIRFSELLSLSTNGDLMNESIDIHGTPVQETCMRQ